MNNNQSGFSAVEGPLILVIVCLIGFVGWRVWQSKNNANKNLNAANTQNLVITTTPKAKTTAPAPKNDVYSGWKTYTSKQEKASFRYPADWMFVDQSSPTRDFVQVKSPNGTILQFDASVTGQGSGACNRNNDPSYPYPACVDIVIKSVEALPNINGLFFVATAGDYPDLSLLSATSVPAAKVGDTGVYQTDFHPTFKSKDGTREVAFETTRIGDSKTNFNFTDAPNIRLVMMSFSY